ncbi:MAG: hypothetical protein KAJ10_04240, partial [Thermodesulfovibrionia bacterium]|nr:hypothetical protein [Thermodesulfovibrionia bacterium]
MKEIKQNIKGNNKWHMMLIKLNSLVWSVVTVIIICFSSAPNPTWASQYSYRTVLPPGWSWSYVHGINDDGDLVGYGGVDSTIKSFLYSNGSFTDLLPPGWSSAYALTINRIGEIVGYGTVNGTDKAFLYI